MLTVLIWLDDLILVAVVIGAWGLAVGAMYIMLNLLIVEYLGLEKLLPVLSIGSITDSVCFLLYGTVSGQQFLSLDVNIFSALSEK